MKNIRTVFICLTVAAAAVAFLPLANGCSASCAKNSDCAAGSVCISGGCFTGSTYDGAFPPYPSDETGCSADSQCGPCEECLEGLCKSKAGCDSGYFPWPDGGGVSDSGQNG